MTNTQPLLDIDAAAAYLGTSAHFIRRLARKKRVTFYELGKFDRFDPADHSEFVNKGRIGCVFR